MQRKFPLIERWYGPGAFRLLLAVIVYINHVTSIQVGTAAVYVFFALSGYWIGELWTKKYEHTRRPYATFLISRAWRLLPTFLVCSALGIASAYGIRSIDSPPPLTAHLLFSSIAIFGYSWLDFRPVGTAWSLDIEMQFYILAPLLVTALSVNSKWTIICGLALSLISWLLLGDRSIVTFLPFFLSGIAASQYRIEFRPNLIRTLTISLFILLLFLSVLPSESQILLGGMHKGKAFSEFNGYLNFVLAFFALPIAFQSVRLESDGLDRAMGEISYVVYMVHALALDTMFRLMPSYATLPHMSRAFVLVGVTAAIGGCSYMIWMLVDRPMNSARSQFVQRRSLSSRVKVRAVSVL